MARRKKADSRNLGLEFYLAVSRFLTGEENLHYGVWTGLEVVASNLGASHRAYTEQLMQLLPAHSAAISDRTGVRILDIGGGAGVPAAHMLALGHAVDVVVPAGILPDRVRVNAPAARVFETRFEEFAAPADRADGYDVCLFGESFQYIPFVLALDKALGLLAPGGVIIIADCFRNEDYYILRQTDPEGARVGGGHRLSEVRAKLATMPMRIEVEREVTEAVAPSVEIQQGLLRVMGAGFETVDKGLAESRPVVHGVLAFLARALVSRRRRERLRERVFGEGRNRTAFAACNTYLMWRLSRTD